MSLIVIPFRYISLIMNRSSTFSMVASFLALWFARPLCLKPDPLAKVGNSILAVLGILPLAVTPAGRTRIIASAPPYLRPAGSYSPTATVRPREDDHGRLPIVLCLYRFPASCSA